MHQAGIKSKSILLQQSLKVTLERLCRFGFNCDDYMTEKNDSSSSRSMISTQQVVLVVSVVVEVAAKAGSRSRK